MSGVTQEDIETVELWIDMWESEITSDDENDREMYEEDRKVIIAVRSLLRIAKRARQMRNEDD